METLTSAGWPCTTAWCGAWLGPALPPSLCVQGWGLGRAEDPLSSPCSLPASPGRHLVPGAGGQGHLCHPTRLPEKGLSVSHPGSTGGWNQWGGMGAREIEATVEGRGAQEGPGHPWWVGGYRGLGHLWRAGGHQGWSSIGSWGGSGEIGESREAGGHRAPMGRQKGIGGKGTVGWG